MKATMGSIMALAKLMGGFGHVPNVIFKRGFQRGDHFYRHLSYKRTNGKWAVRK